MELMEAKREAMKVVPPPKVEQIRLEDGLGRVLAQEITSHMDVPAEPRSQLDGFALKACDTQPMGDSSKIRLTLLPGLLAAGHQPDQVIGPGQCLRILTGAPVPVGADAVIPQEDTRMDGDQIVFDRPLKSGFGIRPAGGDVGTDDVLLLQGDMLTPSRLAMAAALGYAFLPVYKKPRVGLLATGDEVMEPGRPLAGPMTYCNNRYLLYWLTATKGADPFSLGIAGDDSQQIARMLEESDTDMVITTGGVGEGSRDFILSAWKGLGIETVFRQVNLSPGRNSALGIKEERLFWGLPGNPWGAQAVFEELVAPMLCLWQGVVDPRPTTIRATLTTCVKKRQGEYRVIRGSLSLEGPHPSFTPIPTRSRPLLPTIRNGFAYILLGPAVVEVAQGNEVEVKLHDLPLSASTLFGRL